MVSHSRRRIVHAYVRDTWVLVRQFRGTLLLFTALVLVGALILRYAYSPGQPLAWSQALYVSFDLMFFETAMDLPGSLAGQVVFFLWPILGLTLVVNGVVQFGTALFNRNERKEAWQVAVASTFHDHVVVCGLGKIGYRVALELLKMQHEVVGIERDPEAPFLEAIRAEGVPVLIGDVREQALLDRAGVRRASAVVACTEDDLTNLEVALEARDLNPEIKVVMRMFDQQLAERVRKGFGIRTVFSTSALAAPALAAAATRATVDYSFYVGDVLLNVSRVVIAAGSQLVGRRLDEVEHEWNVSVVLCEGADGMDLHPPGERVLVEGDRLVVFATLEALACLNRTNAGQETAPSQERRSRGWLDWLRRKKPTS